MKSETKASRRLLLLLLLLHQLCTSAQDQVCTLFGWSVVTKKKSLRNPKRKPWPGSKRTAVSRHTLCTRTIHVMSCVCNRTTTNNVFYSDYSSHKCLLICAVETYWMSQCVHCGDYGTTTVVAILWEGEPNPCVVEYGPITRSAQNFQHVLCTTVTLAHRPYPACGRTVGSRRIGRQRRKKPKVQ